MQHELRRRPAVLFERSAARSPHLSLEAFDGQWMLYPMSYESCHLNPEDLERYSRHQASEDEMAQFEEHLLLCEACREELRTVDSFATAMRAAAAELRREPERRPWWSIPRLIPAFGVLALLLLGAMGLMVMRNSQPPLAIGLSATRGTGMDAVVPAGRTLALIPDLTGLPADPSYRLEIVDEQGNPTWRGRYTGSPAGQSPAQVSDAATVPAQRSGAHFVRVYSSAGVLLREYGLVVR
jgi:hypothetical protein